MKLYLDTSVYGGYYDKEFSKDTRMFFKCIERHNLKIISSDIIHEEIKYAPENVKSLFLNIEDIEHYKVSEEVKALASLYIQAGALSKQSIADARHIALATIHNASALVSWNFKHLVNFDRIKQYNIVNLREGYRMINIEEPKKIVASYGYY